MSTASDWLTQLWLWVGWRGWWSGHEMLDMVGLSELGAFFEAHPGTLHKLAMVTLVFVCVRGARYAWDVFWRWRTPSMEPRHLAQESVDTEDVDTPRGTPPRADGSVLQTLQHSLRRVGRHQRRRLRRLRRLLHPATSSFEEVFADELCLVNDRRIRRLGRGHALPLDEQMTAVSASSSDASIDAVPEIRVPPLFPAGAFSDGGAGLGSASAPDGVTTDRPLAGPVLPGRVRPSTNVGLVGLALSGGGVRSSTFSLGVLQSLSKYGLLRHVDYLSTVSGGGFMGTCLQSLLSDGTYTTDWESFPLRHVLGEPEGTALRWLRKSGAYLGTGMVDSLLIPILIVRGFILNFMAFFGFVWILILVRDRMGRSVCLADNVFRADECFAWSRIFVANFGVQLVSFPFLNRPYLTLYFLAVFVMLAVQKAQTVFLSAISSPVVMVSALWHLLLSASYWWGNEKRKLWYDRTFGWMALSVIAMVCLESLSLVEWAFLWLTGGSWNAFSSLSALAVLLISDSFAVTILTNTTIAGWKRSLYQAVILITGPLLIAFAYLQVHVLVRAKPLMGLENMVCLLVSLVGLFCIDVNETSMHSFFRDRISAAYCFALTQRTGEENNEEDAMLHSASSIGLAGSDSPREQVTLVGNAKLSETNAANVAPYHLMNATLNLDAQSEGMKLMGRRSEFFMFSKLYVGSVATGYQHTLRMESHDPNLNQATATTISAAAMAPHMGRATINALTLSLTTLNIRLGYWLPNPSSFLLSSRFLSRLLSRSAWLPLMCEFGWPPMRTTDHRLNVSDGGHIDNSAVFPLLRRRAKYIVFIDAEEDPGYQFNGLANLVRLARLDLGCTIQIDVSTIRPDPETGVSASHWTVGRVIYHKGAGATTPNGPPDASGQHPPAGEVGYLLYIKSSFCGTEDIIVQEYRARSPSFPQEPTANQSFGEDQFEAYRSLGWHCSGKCLFGNGRFDGQNVDLFFRRLYARCHTSPLPSGIREEWDRDTGVSYFVTYKGERPVHATWTDPRRANKVDNRGVAASAASCAHFPQAPTPSRP